MTSKIKFIVFLILFFNTYVQAQSCYCEDQIMPRMYLVLAESGIGLRLEPNTDSIQLAVLPYGTEVWSCDRLTDNLNPSNIEKQNGYWIKVKHDDIEGYLFSGLLKDIYTPEIDYSIDVPEQWNEEL